MGKKYILTDETMNYGGVTLHRIRAIRDFSDVKAGDLGGWVEKETNLSHGGDAWVYNNASVYGNARVSNDAWVYGNAQVFNNAEVYGDAQVCDNAQVCGDARVCGNAFVSDKAYICDSAEVYDNAWVHDNTLICGNAWVCGNAEVCGGAKVCGDAVIKNTADYIVFKNWWSSGRYFTWTRSNNMWQVGCFYGSGAELITKAYKDSEESGREYERIVRYVESILAGTHPDIRYQLLTIL